MNQIARTSGSGNVVVQVLGDGNSIVVGHPFLRLTRHTNRRLSALDKPTEMDLLRPYSRGIEMLGREGELSEFWNWLEADDPISVRVVVGSAGRGKTRPSHNWRGDLVSLTE